MQSFTGGCQCRAIRYTTTATPTTRALCHCDSCRRATGAPVAGWITFKRDDVVFTGAPTIYASSKGVQRGFCNACGTPLSFEATYMAGLVDLTIGSLDDPTAATPTHHSWTSRQLPWLQLSDPWPRYAEAPPDDV